MKKINLLKTIVLCCLLAIGCQQSQTDEVKLLKQQIDSLQKLSDSLRFSSAREIEMALAPAPPPTDWCDGNRSDRIEHEINVTQASGYIWNYNQNFTSLARSEGAYSQITRADLSAFEDAAAPGSGTNRCGLLICFYQANNKFFLASILANNVNASSRPTPVLGPGLTQRYFVSKCQTAFLPTDFSSQITLETHLKNSVNTCNDPSTDILGSDLNAGSDLFMNKVNAMVGGAAAEPYAFFHHDQIHRVITQTNCIGIRIYWGYDAGKIKLVVFGIKRDGKNITAAGAKILQRSWPPY